MKRQISPNEKMYLGFEKEYSSFSITRIIEGIGQISLLELKEVVETVSREMPETQLVLNKNMWESSGRLTSVTTIGEKFLKNGFERLINEKFVLKEGPLTRVILIKKEKTEGYYIIFSVHHGIMDGVGATLWIQNIFLKLNGQNIVKTNSLPRDIDLLETLKEKKKSDIITVGKYLPLKNYIYGENKSVKAIKFSIEGAHPNISSKLMEIIHDYSQEKTSRFILTKNIRETFLSEEKNTGNLSLPVYIEVNGERWNIIYKKILEKILKKEDIIYSGLEYGIFSFFSINNIGKGLRYLIKKYSKKGKTAATSVISNLGKIELKKYSTSSFIAKDVYSLPVITPMVPMSFVITELENSCSITLGYYENSYEEREVLLYIEKIKESFANENSQKISHQLVEGNKIENNFDLLTEINEHLSLEEICVIDIDERIKYSDINKKANELAGILISMGIKKGDRIVLLLKRDKYYIISLIAIMKIGAVFIPIDPEYPEERIKYILSNSNSKLILTINEIFKLFENTLCLSILIDEIKLPEEKIVEIESNSYLQEDPLYIIYTSGSTGNPKGVTIAYKTFCNYINFSIRNYDIDEKTIFGFFTSISFDLSLTAIFTTLCCGGKLEMFKERVDAGYLKKIFENSEMNSMKITPTHLDMINALSNGEKKMKLIIVGGEQLRRETAKKAQENFGINCKIINEYGPTETTVGSVFHIFDILEDTKETVPIGLPIDNCEVLLEKKEDEKVGELLIGGDCLGKGYWDNATETSKKFIDIEGKKYYRSGDICVLNSQKKLDFIERKDSQVKIRGYRIEIEEIEVAMEKLVFVERAKVFPNANNSLLICTYINNEMRENGTLIENRKIEEKIREELEKTLPKYMIPNSFIPVGNFPLTDNGKLDMKKIKKVVLENQEIENLDLSDEEIIIVGIVEDILERKVLEEELFYSIYQLGGDSLFMVRLINELESKCFKTVKEREVLNNNLDKLIVEPTLVVIKNILLEAKKTNI